MAPGIPQRRHPAPARQFLAAKVSSACCVSDSASPLPHFLVQLPGWTILASRLAREWPSRSGPQTPACGSGGAPWQKSSTTKREVVSEAHRGSDRRKTTSDTFAVSSPKRKLSPRRTAKPGPGWTRSNLFWLPERFARIGHAMHCCNLSPLGRAYDGDYLFWPVLAAAPNNAMIPLSPTESLTERQMCFRLSN